MCIGSRPMLWVRLLSVSEVLPCFLFVQYLSFCESISYFRSRGKRQVLEDLIRFLVGQTRESVVRTNERTHCDRWRLYNKHFFSSCCKEWRTGKVIVVEWFFMNHRLSPDTIISHIISNTWSFQNWLIQFKRKVFLI